MCALIGSNMISFANNSALKDMFHAAEYLDMKRKSSKTGTASSERRGYNDYASN